MFDDEVRGTISELARKVGLEPEVLLAVVEVESGGESGTRIGGRLEPLIRWEGHYFYKQLPPGKREAAVRQGLASPNAGGVPNPRGQSDRYALLERAKAIDPAAALASCSWGVGQVMGANWEWLGYKNVDDLVETARSGLAGQVELMLRFIQKRGLIDELARHDWAAFASVYNGPSYRTYRYDEKMRDAHRRHAGRAKPDLHGVLRLSDSGPEVSLLQEQLRKLGYALHVDGEFGPATRRAVENFQREHGFVVDGVVGPKTWAAIESLARPAVVEPA